jgi:hypothetical protein
MVDPFVMMLDNMIDEDPFALALAKRKFEEMFFHISIEEDPLSYYIDMGGSGLFIGRHGYTGMGDFYSGTHGNTGMGFF